jgi:hypothetical protein
MRCRYLVPLLFAAACSSAIADQAVAPQAPPPPPAEIALAGAPVKVRAPYDVQILRDGGETLPTYGLKDRYYVQGNAGERYVIRITNPTPNRVEAVVSVDGVDVIDGDAGDLHKRGYVIPPYGETRVEGFRTSTADVATFRFSSVDGSYAAQTGKPRNVGVIAVALFEEQHQEEQQIVTPETAQRPRPYDYRDDVVGGAEYQRRGGGGVDDTRSAMSKKAPSTPAATHTAPPPPPPAAAPQGGYNAGVGAADESAPPSARRMERERDTDGLAQNEVAPTHRPGLGTEFGEQRYSAASYTRFVRAADRPVAVAELRYNDAAGLIALGIPVQPMPDDGELMTRETADPFPGDGRFAHAPGSR